MQGVEKFLTTEEQERIVNCVRQAETRTSGEIVSMVVSASGSYQISALLAALSVILPAALIIVELLRLYGFVDRAALYIFLLISATGCSALYYLMVKEGRFTGLFRHFLLAKDVAEEVEESALAAFYEEGLHRTAGNNGVLLYISVFEQRLWILADSGIDDRIDGEYWQQIARQAGSELAAGRVCDAICQAIESIAQLLEEHFPCQQGDKDELDNLVIGR